MLATLLPGCQTYPRPIGWQGGSGQYDVAWNPNEQFWLCSSYSKDSRWVFFFGAGKPVAHRMNHIACEINPPKEGINRRCAGLFVRDAEGTIYLTHSGKVGGGRAGIGKSTFLSHYRGAPETVVWPDGKKSEVIVLGRIDGARFSEQVANFIREVQRYKATVTGGSAPSTSAQPPPEPQFNQEFSGQRRGYRLPSEIESRCDHGLIINNLARALQAIGFEVANDRSRDLYVPGRNGLVQILFEAKADVSTSTIYQAIGQLLYHSAMQSPSPTLVMVLPGMPDVATRHVLDRLQIKVLVFRWQGKQPAFRNLTDVIA